MDSYSVLIDKIKNNMLKYGRNHQDIQQLFLPAKIEKLKYLSNLYDTFSFYSQAYMPEELNILKSLSTPKDVIEFYKLYEPNDGVSVFGRIILFDLENIKRYNSSSTTEGFLLKCGFLTIANTISGNLICLDLNGGEKSKVMGVSSNIVMYNYDLQRIEYLGGDDDEDYTELTYLNLLKDTIEVADTFRDFIKCIAEEDSQLFEVDCL